MDSQHAIEPPAAAIGSDSARPGTASAAGPPPAAPRDHRRPPRFLAGMLSALRGDKYMAGAYPPAWPTSSTRPDPVPGPAAGP